MHQNLRWKPTRSPSNQTNVLAGYWKTSEIWRIYDWAASKSQTWQQRWKGFSFSQTLWPNSRPRNQWKLVTIDTLNALLLSDIFPAAKWRFNRHVFFPLTTNNLLAKAYGKNDIKMPFFQYFMPFTDCCKTIKDSIHFLNFLQFWNYDGKRTLRFSESFNEIKGSRMRLVVHCTSEQ